MKLRLWIVLGLVAAAYAGVPQAGFVWDDHALIEQNRNLTAPTWETVFLRDLWCCTEGPRTGYHRPLLTVSYLLDHAIWGLEPHGYHLSSLLWHLLVVTLVAAALRPRLGETRAAVAALIFGLHPLQSEAVVWIAARNDLMAAAGVLGTLVALDRRRPAVAALATVAACLSKESGYLLPAVLVVWRLAWGERPRLPELAAIGGGVAVALTLRSAADLSPLAVEAAVSGLTPAEALHAAVTVLAWISWPWPLTTTASVHMTPPGVTTWTAAACTSVAVALLVWRGGRPAFWLLALSAGVYGPAVLGIGWYGTIGERYLYLPLFGFVAALVAVVPSSAATRAAVVAAAAAALVALHVRLPDWAHEEALFGAAVRRAPDGYSWNLLAVELGRQRRAGEAVAAVERGLQYEPFNSRLCSRPFEFSEPIVADADLVRLAARWADLGCRGIAGYDGMHAMALARRGLWDEAAAIAETAVRNDVKLRRDEVVRAAIDAREGDLASFGARALFWPHGAADLQDRVAGLLLAVRAPNGAPLGRPPAPAEAATEPGANPGIPAAERPADARVGASAAPPVAPAPAPQ